MRALVGKGNPTHVDTTFGKSVYCTFFTFQNTCLINQETGIHPTWFGAALVHT